MAALSLDAHSPIHAIDRIIWLIYSIDMNLPILYHTHCYRTLRVRVQIVNRQNPVSRPHNSLQRWHAPPIQNKEHPAPPHQ